MYPDPLFMAYGIVIFMFTALMAPAWLDRYRRWLPESVPGLIGVCGFFTSLILSTAFVSFLLWFAYWTRVIPNDAY